MTSYSKSLLALVIALISVLFAGLWVRSRMTTASNLNAAVEDMRIRLAAMSENEELIGRFEQRLEDLREEIKPVTDKFVGENYEIHQLVMAVVNSASATGMQMVNACTLEHGDDWSFTWLGRQVSRISHEIRLKGSYSGLVGFLQSMDNWPMGAQINSMNIAPVAYARADGVKARDEVDVILNLSVFVLEEESAIE